VVDFSERAFIRERARAGTSAAQIAKMIGRPVQDVLPWVSCDQTEPAPDVEPAVKPPPARINREPRAVLWKPQRPTVQVYPCTGVRVTFSASVDLPTGRLGFAVTHRATRVTVAEIQKLVAEHFRLPLKEMSSECRRREVARPRQVAMWLCKQLTNRSMPDIGRRFGGRDHTTVLHAVRRIEALRVDDPVIAYDCNFLVAQLGGMPA
jgi:hypothetical protein